MLQPGDMLPDEPLLYCSTIDPCSVLAVKDGDLVFESYQQGNLLSLYLLDLDSGQITLLHQDPENISDIYSHPVGRVPDIASYDSFTLHHHGLTEQDETVLRQLSSWYGNARVLHQFSDDKQTVLTARFEANQIVPDYLIYRVGDNAPQAFPAAAEESGTRPYLSRLGSRKKISYTSRDGFTLYGYISLPPGKEPSTLPLVTIVHGGPIARTVAEYNVYTQHMITRGYAVFEPDFRASTGYGLDYIDASAKDWGDGLVQNDIIDGIDHVLSLGIGDTQKQAIMGGSFGGFSVLSALAFTPERFVAGAALVPPADLTVSARMLFESRYFIENPKQAAVVRRWLHNPDDPEEVATLQAQSPMSHLMNITRPLLIIAGADDDRVSIAQVKEYSLDLFNAGKPVTVVIDEDMGHGTSEEVAALANLYLIESFFAEYLGGNLEPLQNPHVRQYVEEKILLQGNSDYTPVTLQ